MAKRKKKNKGLKSWVLEGTFAGFIIGFILDIILSMINTVSCSQSELQKLLGISPVCIRLYFLSIILAIIGGIIGYFIKKK